MEVIYIFLIINSISLFPQYIYRHKNINPFYKYKDNPGLYQYQISILNNNEKMNLFIISFLKEKKNIIIEKISEKIISFLINKTYGGIQEQVITLLLYLYDNKFIYVNKINEKSILIEDEKFNMSINTLQY